MTETPIFALLYADGVYPDGEMRRAVDGLRDRGVRLAGVLERPPGPAVEKSRCDMLLEDLATGDVRAISENRGEGARGCRLDAGALAEAAQAALRAVREDVPRLLVLNKFGKIEADGGGMRQALAEAIEAGIPVLVGVPARNLDRWRAFAGPFAIESRRGGSDLDRWLEAQGLPSPAGAGAPRADCTRATEG